VDALSDVLRAVRLSGAIFFDVRASQSWVAETPAGSAIVASMFPASEHLISYHVIVSGDCGVSNHPHEFWETATLRM
jgi:Cupin